MSRRLLSSLVLLALLTTSAFAMDDAVLKMRKWKLAAPDLSEVLKKNGWWTPSEKIHLGHHILVLENKKFSVPHTTVLRSRGVIEPRTKFKNIKIVGETECKRSTKKGAVSVFKYNKKTDYASCWIYDPALDDQRHESHTFITFRTLSPSSQAFIANTAMIKLDKNKMSPHPIARKIASELEAK